MAILGIASTNAVSIRRYHPPMILPAQTLQASVTTPLGPMIVAVANRHMVGMWFADGAHVPSLEHCPLALNNPLVERVQSQLIAYLAGQRKSFDLPLQLDTGTALQNAVWQALAALPYGQTCSYGELAARVGRPGAARAVAAAVARNPINIVVPCHRVIGASGALTGYSGGLARKQHLLKLEGAR